MAGQPRHIYVNVPVRDVAASAELFRAAGFDLDDAVASDEVACIVLSEHARVLMQAEPRFAEFAAKPVADAHVATEAILCVTAESREEVDALADGALAAGASPANEPVETDSQYLRSFHDLDGHLWEIIHTT